MSKDCKCEEDAAKRDVYETWKDKAGLRYVCGWARHVREEYAADLLLVLERKFLGSAHFVIAFDGFLQLEHDDEPKDQLETLTLFIAPRTGFAYQCDDMISDAQTFIEGFLAGRQP